MIAGVPVAWSGGRRPVRAVVEPPRALTAKVGATPNLSQRVGIKDAVTEDNLWCAVSIEVGEGGRVRFAVQAGRRDLDQVDARAVHLVDRRKAGPAGVGTDDGDDFPSDVVVEVPHRQASEEVRLVLGSVQLGSEYGGVNGGAISETSRIRLHLSRR